MPSDHAAVVNNIQCSLNIRRRICLTLATYFMIYRISLILIVTIITVSEESRGSNVNAVKAVPVHLKG